MNSGFSPHTVFDPQSLMRIGPDEDHGGHLAFNSRLMGSNVPFRGQFGVEPPLRGSEYDELTWKPVGKIGMFDLSDPEQKEAYELIFHRICCGWYVKIHQEHHWDAARKAMMVYLEWCQMYRELPPHLERFLTQRPNRPAPVEPTSEPDTEPLQGNHVPVLSSSEELIELDMTRAPEAPVSALSRLRGVLPTSIAVYGGSAE